MAVMSRPPVSIRQSSPPVVLLRDFLLGRAHLTALRSPDVMSAKTQPPPCMPTGPHYMYAENYYLIRDARGEVKPPTAITQDKQDKADECSDEPGRKLFVWFVKPECPPKNVEVVCAVSQREPCATKSSKEDDDACAKKVDLCGKEERGEKTDECGKKADACAKKTDENARKADECGKEERAEKTDACAKKADACAKKTDENARKADECAKKPDECAKKADDCGKEHAEKTDKCGKKADACAKKTDENARKAEECAKKADELAKKADECAKKADEYAKKADECAKKAGDFRKEKRAKKTDECSEKKGAEETECRDEEPDECIEMSTDPKKEPRDRQNGEKLRIRTTGAVISGLRDFLLGRKHETALRTPDEMAPRSIPTPCLPEGPYARLCNNDYHTRDARREVTRPTEIKPSPKRDKSEDRKEDDDECEFEKPSCDENDEETR